MPADFKYGILILCTLNILYFYIMKSGSERVIPLSVPVLAWILKFDRASTDNVYFIIYMNVLLITARILMPIFKLHENVCFSDSRSGGKFNKGE